MKYGRAICDGTSKRPLSGDIRLCKQTRHAPLAVDEGKLQEFIDRAVVHLGGAANAVLMSLGDELGSFEALAKAAALEYPSRSPDAIQLRPRSETLKT